MNRSNGKTADPVVFAFTIDHGTGEVSMAQYRAVDHGDEEASPGAHDEVATMLSGKLSVTLTVTDKDGDTVSASKDISGSITFDDDGPKANCDVDCVTEGETDGKLNYASGNVVTGVDGGLGTDANGLDGNADNPGTDKPYTISKITHDGVTHELSADGQNVSNLGPDELRAQRRAKFLAIG